MQPLMTTSIELVCYPHQSLIQKNVVKGFERSMILRWHRGGHSIQVFQCAANIGLHFFRGTKSARQCFIGSMNHIETWTALNLINENDSARSEDHIANACEVKSN